MRGQTFYAKFRTSGGQWVGRAIGTRDRTVATRVARMLDELGHRGRQEWFFIDALEADRISLSQLFAAWTANDLTGLRRALEDIDLRPWIDSWLAAIVGQVTDESRKHYEAHLATLFVANEPFPRSRLTPGAIRDWLARVGGSAGTRRRYRAALSAFCEYLMQHDVLTDNPVRRVKAPPPAPPRCSYLDLKQTKRVLASLAEPYRTVAAIAHGCGADLSQILHLRSRDVDLSTEQIHLSGGKTAHRNRSVVVEPWAWKYVARHIASLEADAPLFPTLNRWTVSDKFKAACKRAEITNYWLRDSRHSYAVRMVKAGVSPEVIACQLGHADVTLIAKVYGRYRPEQAEIRSGHAKAARLSGGGSSR